MTTAATISARLILDSTSYDKGLDDAGKKADTFGGKASSTTSGPMKVMGDAFQRITGVSMGAGIGIGLATTAVVKGAQFFSECATAANESAVEVAKNEAILKATGYAAGMTSEKVQNLAGELSKLTGVDDEMIISAESMMLTFRNVSGDTFPRAIKASLDLQTTFGDLNSSTLQLGKALNDPLKGVTALARSGVTFSETQKDMIKNFVETNQIAKAQAVILDEVERQVGGTAKAMNDASNGINNFNNSLGNVKEMFGGGVNNLFGPVRKSLSDLMDEFVASDDVFRDQSKLFNEAGVQVNILNAHYKDGVLLAKETADEILNNAQVAENSANNYIAMGRAIQGAGEAAVLSQEQIDEMNASMTKANEEMIKGVEKFQNLYESSNEKIESLSSARSEMENQLQTLRMQGYSDQSEEIQKVIGKMAENDLAVQNTAIEHDKATKSIILGYMEQILAVDGLTDEEADALIKQGVAWGVYSQDAVTAFQTAMDQARALTDKINAIPAGKTVNIDVITRYTDEYGRRAVDAAPGRAAGGAASGMTWVGEKGPELVDLPQGSFVHNNAESQRMSSGGYDGPTARDIGEQTALAIMKFGANSQQ